MPVIKSKQTAATNNGKVPSATTSKLMKLGSSTNIPQRDNGKPFWDGPESNTPNGGISFSMLSKYLACAERFRIQTIEGLKEADRFNHSLAYGEMWHLCEEYHAANKPWQLPLKEYARKLAVKYREAQHEVEKYYNVCCVQFPVYVAHWSKHPDVKNRKPLLQEQVFGVSYKLPSGRVVILRGKFDSVDDIVKEGIYLQENKSKGDFTEQQIRQQLTYDLQTMEYLIALEHFDWTKVKDVYTDKFVNIFKGLPPIKGVRYNVIRRPLSGGLHSISQHKGRGAAKTGAETPEQFYKRLGKLIAENAEYFFLRIKSEISEEDIDTFKRQCFHPILENLCDDYEWWSYAKQNKANHFDYIRRGGIAPHHQARHFVYPYGVYNVTAEGRNSPYDQYVRNGDKSGLVKTTTLFPELVGV